MSAASTDASGAAAGAGGADDVVGAGSVDVGRSEVDGGVPSPLGGAASESVDGFADVDVAWAAPLPPPSPALPSQTVPSTTAAVTSAPSSTHSPVRRCPDAAGVGVGSGRAAGA